MSPPSLFHKAPCLSIIKGWLADNFTDGLFWQQIAEGERTLGCLLPPKVFLIRWINNFEDFFKILTGWCNKLSFQTFQPLIAIYKRGNFVYNHFGI